MQQIIQPEKSAVDIKEVFGAAVPIHFAQLIVLCEFFTHACNGTKEIFIGKIKENPMEWLREKAQQFVEYL